MSTLRLTETADVGVMYDADQLRYDPEVFAALGVSREHVIQHYSQYPSRGYEIDGQVAGGAVFDGNQIHLAVLPQYYGRWAWLLKPTLEWLFSLREQVPVQIEQSNIRCLRFMDAGKWPRIDENERMVTYLLSRENNRLFRRLGTSANTAA
ncbi:hypothetical protein AAKU55_003602 [Oxalobacteraceae bacterium GrIS 1.11]